MKMLIPTDFSPTANLAIEYGATLASEIHASVTLLHVVTPMMASPGMQGVMADAKIAMMNDALENIKMTASALSESYPEIKVNYLIAEGENTDTILEKAKETDADYIVMGTLGASGLGKKLFGSNTVNVMTHSRVPVIIVPPDTNVMFPEKIVFAADYLVAEMEALRNIIDFAVKGDAELEIVHVISADEDAADEKELIKDFRDEVERFSEYGKISYHVFRSNDIAEGISDFTSATGARMIAFTTGKRGGFEKLFGRSITEEFAYKSMIPIVAFHARGSR
ncbi:MAG: universal stress protein [Alphaproteobacteria bacterium]